MYDAISANAPVLIPKNPSMLAIYNTGSSIIIWTPADVALFPHVETWVRIDQGGPGAPNYKCNVIDVEPHAWAVSDIPNWTSKCTAPRPTVYCDRADLSAVMKVWKGDIWLAAPGLSQAECLAMRAANKQLVAIQNVFGGSFDSSVVMDTTWPEKAVVNPVPPPPPVKTFPIAPAPPGVWKEGAVMVGIGTDGHVYETTYSVATGKWSGTVKVV
jgi:hypothetical protein